MKKITLFLIIVSCTFAGRLGIGLAGGGQYPNHHETLTPEQFLDLYYGAELSVQAEALPHVYLEPFITYLNNPSHSSSSAGVGLGITLRPRLGRFFIAPAFGIKGTLLFCNDVDIADAIKNGQLNEYIESSSPRLNSTAFAGLTILFGEKMSLDCQYRYCGLTQEYGIEMVWAGLNYYINW
ncbi:hypothetical protein AMJ52_03135 [candidate division TA06 bacterium DG_78]|uniref:Uncharacterized protein n=1 Tax=candidate division TA06 bacterium DG_78 TaxID=1703772 RepID=A0A0S7YGA6_UNCT6|nr:MAG: hypothetical protein AMJ52_03135 [candidate division TA06 bacterium DG_78]